MPDLHPAGDRGSAGRAAGVGTGAVVAASVTATLAFWAYARTLLPGVDFGDTGGFQAAVLWREVSARQAYPLYYLLARPFVLATSPAHPAVGLNLFSATCAALAVGALTAATAFITRSIRSGAIAGLSLAFSYTFWSQAIIAEVYALHLLLIGACLLALYAYWIRPSRPRLAAFFVVFAVAFGNHFSMILLLVPFAVFLLIATERPRNLLQPTVVALALGSAAAGALLYLPNFLAVAWAIDGPATWSDRAAAFWFDVTKADWRESMVLGVQASQWRDRVGMLIFDARQQFGLVGLAAAALGTWRLFHRVPAWGTLVAVAWLINTIFAFTYNVGDPHVFFLPGHYYLALACGVAVAPPLQPGISRSVAVAAAVLVGGAVAWRAFDDWPAIDRHADRRAEEYVGRLTTGLHEGNAVLLTHLNWQVENAILYETRYERPTLLWVRLPEVMLHLPLFVRDNHAIERLVVLDSEAAARAAAAFGPLFPLVRDDRLPVEPLDARVHRVPRGAPYVLTMLTPPREHTLDDDALDRTIATLTGASAARRGNVAYEVISGIAGERPQLHVAADLPFRERLEIGGMPLDIRIESWVPTETFRRGGFGFVVRDREKVLAIERGVSFVWFRPSGTSAEPAYAAGLYELQPRFVIPSVESAELARLAQR